MSEDGAVKSAEDGAGLSLLDVKRRIEREHRLSLPDDDPALIMVTIMRAALEEEERLQERHRKKLADVMNGMVNDLASAVKTESAGIGDMLSGVAVQELQRVSHTLQESGTGVAERLSGHAIALYLCTGIIAASALFNVYVYLVR